AGRVSQLRKGDPLAEFLERHDREVRRLLLHDDLDLALRPPLPAPMRQLCFLIEEGRDDEEPFGSIHTQQGRETVPQATTVAVDEAHRPAIIWRQLSREPRNVPDHFFE